MNIAILGGTGRVGSRIAKELRNGGHAEPGERTGQYRTGDDGLLVTSDGRSYISMEDFAVASVDELECPAHSRTRLRSHIKLSTPDREA
jgi:putative NADH-flavin reductase